MSGAAFFRGTTPSMSLSCSRGKRATKKPPTGKVGGFFERSDLLARINVAASRSAQIPRCGGSIGAMTGAREPYIGRAMAVMLKPALSVSEAQAQAIVDRVAPGRRLAMLSPLLSG